MTDRGGRCPDCGRLTLYRGTCMSGGCDYDAEGEDD